MNADAIAGSLGELLSADVFTYCQNNPVKLVDKDGFHPALWDESDDAEDYTPSPQSTPVVTQSKTNNSSSVENVISSAVSTVAGALAEHLETVNYTLEKDGTLGLGTTVVKALPNSFNETVKPYAKEGGALGIAGAVGFWVYDTINIFRAHDGLTSGQKWTKVGIHTALTIGVFAIGAVFLSPLLAYGAVGWVAGFGLSCAVGFFANKAEKNYDKAFGVG